MWVLFTQPVSPVPHQTNPTSQCLRRVGLAYCEGVHRLRNNATRVVCSIASNKAGAGSSLETSVGALVGANRRVVGTSDLSRGFCNSVHLVTTETSGGAKERLVVKLYSDLSTLRVPAGTRGKPDALAAANGLAPAVVNSTHAGIVHEYIDGETLTEEDIHCDNNSSLLLAAAHRLAQLHQLPIPPPFSPEPLLWTWLEVMITTSCGDGAKLPDFVKRSQLESEISFMRDALCSVGAPVVFAHGDLKPSNMIFLPGPSCTLKSHARADNLQFIDLELAGPNYRGFDIMKLFRADKGFSESNMRMFLHEYIAQTNKHHADVGSLGNVEQVYAEARMFEPLTWLEAAVFFVLVLSTQENQTHGLSRNYDLGKQRWNRYLESKSMVDKYHSRACR
mmetsp:Transcript_9495/g.17826  ORF Transcript_9495/g.17826 Transcript_9495/m.17826 type:complete len:392 (+) Transcript_9495:226-1401(+)